MPHKAEYPEVGDLVVCSVQNVKNFGAFVTLDEYANKEGFIHVRDVATGWVKYIRDHVREGQKVVCKVLGVDASRGHIDLSLKQVNEHQRREKIQDWKNEKKADKLLEIVSTKMGSTPEQAYSEVGDRLVKEFGSLYGAFESVAADPGAIKDLGLDRKWASTVAEVAAENIVIASVAIDGMLEVTSPRPDAVDHIKEALAAGVEGGEAEVKIHYIGAPRYKISVDAEDYKVAEQELKAAVDRITASIEKSGGKVSFRRKEER